MKIVVTGNPNYEGLCKGIYEAYNHNFVEFIGRYNGWDLTDFDKVADPEIIPDKLLEPLFVLTDSPEISPIFPDPCICPEDETNDKLLVLVALEVVNCVS